MGLTPSASPAAALDPWAPRIEPLSPTERILYGELRKTAGEQDRKVILECEGILALDRQRVEGRYAAELQRTEEPLIRTFLEEERELNIPGSTARIAHFDALGEGVRRWETESLSRLRTPQAEFGGLTGEEQFQLLMRRGTDQILVGRNLSPEELDRAATAEKDNRARMGLLPIEDLRARLARLRQKQSEPDPEGDSSRVEGRRRRANPAG
jgi:hypothetical protein